MKQTQRISKSKVCNNQTSRLRISLTLKLLSTRNLLQISHYKAKTLKMLYRSLKSKMSVRMSLKMKTKNLRKQSTINLRRPKNSKISMRSPLHQLILTIENSLNEKKLLPMSLSQEILHLRLHLSLYNLSLILTLSNFSSSKKKQSI